MSCYLSQKKGVEKGSLVYLYIYSSHEMPHERSKHRGYLCRKMRLVKEAFRYEIISAIYSKGYKYRKNI